jgi:hypothetical protein
MAQDLILAEPMKVLSLPGWLAALRVGTVTWPDQPTRKYLAGGLSLTSDQRAEAEPHLVALRDALNSEGEKQARARSVILAKMLLAAGGAALTEKVAEAKGEAYADALDDTPAWAVQQAIRRWNRHECGDRNYSFAPAPGVLREIVLDVMRPYLRLLEQAEAAASAMTLDEAMDPKPIAREKSLVPRFKTVG